MSSAPSSQEKPGLPQDGVPVDGAHVCSVGHGANYERYLDRLGGVLGDSVPAKLAKPEPDFSRIGSFSRGLWPHPEFGEDFVGVEVQALAGSPRKEKSYERGAG